MLSGICTRAGNLACLCFLLRLPSSAQVSAAETLITQGHYTRARPLVQAALQKHPGDVNALIALSTIQWAFGQLDASTATAEKAVFVADQNSAAHAQLVNALGAKLASSKTGTFEKMGISRRFRSEVDRTLALDPGNIYAHEAMARFYWYAPAMAGGSRSKARQWVEKLVHLDAVRGYALKAELDASESDKAKNLPAVENDWRQAVAANPKSFEAHAGLGSCLLANAAREREAEDEARKVLALEPSRIDSYRLLASAYATAGRWDQLEALLKNARSSVPDDLAAEFMAAQAILDNNASSQWARAEEHLRAYIRQPAEGQEPSTATAHWKLGVVLQKEGRRGEALKELRTAVNLDSSLNDVGEVKKALKELQ